MTLYEFLAILVLGVASYRVTRFFVIDSFFAKVRQKLHTWLSTRTKATFLFTKVYDLISCTWCLGVWISFFLFWFYLGTRPDYWTSLDWISFIAVAGIQGFLHALEPEE